jgi:hypothetical protein
MRSVSTCSGGGDRSWLFLPAEPVLRAHAAQVEDEIHRVLRRDRGDEEGWDETEDRLLSERSDPELGFVPVAADVVPQMNLFGEPGDVAVQPMAAPAPAAADPPAEAGEPAAVPAFERRRILRARRHGLVSELARSRRCGHREANQWINQKVGLRRVDEATIEQLERSCDLLVSELARRR